MRLKLISQTPILESINYVLEEKNKNEPSTMYVEGIYMVAEEVNKNRRKYQLEEMVAEMKRFDKELIQENRALGELEHTCFHDKTKILTTDGWKFIKDVSDDEVVATLNTETEKIEYQKIDKKVDVPYSGKMIRVKGKNINTLVTPNHRFLLKDRKGEYLYHTAQELLDMKSQKKITHLAIPNIGYWDGADDEFFTFPPLEMMRGRKIVKENCKPMHCLQFDISTQIHIDFRFLEITEEDFDDRVYCVSVPNKNFYAMDDGKCFWTGNSEPTVNSERACHMIVEMRQEGNQFYGKSKVLSSTPMGGILRGLIKDGVKMGMSTRALGQLHEEAGYSRVSNFKLITVDAVADPSAPGAFVDGILESKEWVLSNNGHLEEYYIGFENKLGRLPKKDLESFLKEQILQFIKGLK